MGNGILPTAIHNGQLFFLFGFESTDKLWSNFGGKKEGNETPIKTLPY